MIKIAHRGNINGPNPEKENHPDYINQALSQELDVEIDVWWINNTYVLGHDGPQYEVDANFIRNIRFWHHAKNIEALFQLNNEKPNYSINCFFHDTDAATLTSGGWIWTYPGQLVTDQSVAVMPERVPNWNVSQAYGVCTDFPYSY